MHPHTGAIQEEDPRLLRILIMNRRKRRLGNVDEISRAISADELEPLRSRRRCMPLAGECDLGWSLSWVRQTQMEGMSAAEQIRTWLDGPNVVIVPHGAGSTHATYLPPCSIVIEVVPNMYPQFSFLVPTMRSGSHMLYMYEASCLGNPHLTCLNSSSGNSRVARGDPIMQVHTPLLLQLLHRGAAIRRRCLAHYPQIELMPHERLVQGCVRVCVCVCVCPSPTQPPRIPLAPPTHHMQVALARLGQYRVWEAIPQLKAAQEAIQYHQAIPTIATGYGVTRQMAESEGSLAARRLVWACRTCDDGTD